MTEIIVKALDDGNFACGIFVDLQKTSDTVDLNIFLSKLSLYGIRGKTNKSYMSERKRFVSIKGFDSDMSNVEYVKTIKCSLPQRSVLAPLLFLIYFNDLNLAIKYCKVHHFADDTNLLNINKPSQKLNKLINADLKNSTNWLNADKLSLNVSKTELVIFKPKKKQVDFDIKMKLNGKRLYPTDSPKNLV